MFARQVDSCYGTLWVWGLEWVCKNWNSQGFTTQLHHKLHLAYYDAKSATLQWAWFLNCPPQFYHAVHTDEASLTAHQCVFGQRNILFYYFLCVVACNVLLWFVFHISILFYIYSNWVFVHSCSDLQAWQWSKDSTFKWVSFQYWITFNYYPY